MTQAAATRRPGAFWLEWLGLSGGRGAGAVLAAATFLVAARHLPAADFGMLAAGLAVGAVVAVVADLGTSQIVLRAGGRIARRSVVRDCALVPRTAVTVIGLGGMATAAATGASGAGQLLWLATSLALLCGGMISFEALAFGILIGSQRTGRSVALLLLDRAVSFGSLVALGASGHWLVGLVLSQTLGFVPALLVTAGLLRRVPDAQTPSVPASDRFAFLRASLSAQAQNLEVPIVGSIAGAVQAAYMGLASRLTGPLSIAASAGASLILRAPAGASQAAGTGPVRWGRRESLIAAATSSPLLVCAALPSGTLEAVVGEQYKAGTVVVRLVLLTVALNAVVQPLVALLQRARASRGVANIVTGSVLVGLATCAAGAAARGAEGGALGMLASQVLQLALFVWFARRALGDRREAERCGTSC